jgi:hypothetical protein
MNRMNNSAAAHLQVQGTAAASTALRLRKVDVY